MPKDAAVSTGAGTAATVPAGSLVKACHIDLPPNDVLDSIDFERFFRLNLTVAQAAPKAAQKAAEAEQTVLADAHPPSRHSAALGAPLQPAHLDVRTLRLALYMPFRQDWELKGYNRGRIVNSFSLAPGEEQTVEVFTWDRLTSSLESATSFESEQTVEASGTRRDTVDVAQDVSSHDGFEMHTNGNVGFTVGIVNVQAGAGGSASAGANEAEKATRSAIVEATGHSMNRVRTSRTLTVRETRESGREDRVTRRLRNPNACHTLTVPFFEVLASYAVETYLRTAEVRLVVLLPTFGLISDQPFDRAVVREHETTLRRALLDTALADGFDAARLLDARDRACDVLCTGCSCEDLDAGSEEGPLWTAVTDAVQMVVDAAGTVQMRALSYPASVFTALLHVQDGIEDIERYLFRKALQKSAPRLLTDVASLGLAQGAPGQLVTQAQARRLATVLTGLNVAALTFDPGLSSGVGSEIYGVLYWAAVTNGADPLIAANVIADVQAGIVRGNANNLATYLDDGLLAAVNQFLGAYGAWTALAAARKQQTDKEIELERIAKQERDLRILETFGLREVASAEERLDALLAHLNEPRNTNHYRFAIWNERGAAVDDTVINLALTGLIDPTPVGLVGDDLAVPLRLESSAELQAFYDATLADLVARTPVDTKPGILPTAALYAEAIVGECCACESSIMKREHLTQESMTIANEHATLENRRLQGRIDAGELDLDPAAPSRFDVHVATESEPPVAPTS